MRSLKSCQRGAWIFVAAVSCVWATHSGTAQEVAVVTEKDQPTSPEAAPQAVTPLAVVADDSETKPRFELHVPSVKNLLADIHRSRSGFILSTVHRMLTEAGKASAEGVDVEQVAELLKLVGQWPDTAIDAVTFAPDREGRLRWAIAVDWPLEALRGRVQDAVSSAAAKSLLEGVALDREQDKDVVRLSGTPLVYLLACGEGRSLIATHPDMSLPDKPFTGSAETAGDQPPALVCRLNLMPTEKDSGAGAFSQFRIVTGVEYAARVSPEGEWLETVHVHWPPLAGMGAKAFLGKVKQSFFVPAEAFGAVVVQPLNAASIVDGLAGFGPQMMMGASGEIAMMGERQAGPVAGHGGEEACFAILPGTGFLPAPDLVTQMRVKHPDEFVKDVRKAVSKINDEHRGRELPEPWTEVEVKGRPVFWSDSRSSMPGMVMPLVFRPVIFTTQERDAEDRQRDFLVVAWTSTSPERFVQRWVELPRGQNSKHLPTSRKTNGQGWIHWKTAYDWIHPYINVALSATVRDTLLPRTEEVAAQLTDALLTLEVKYTGMHVEHGGPIPLGAVVVPSLAAVSMQADESGGSDLARERLAAQRLKVFYHHCKLFHKDQGRWPAELAELDGYIDFAGHPELLELEVSAQKRFSNFFKDLLTDEEDEKKEKDDEDVLPDFDQKVFVIHWGREAWRLGLAPGTLEHLQELYIDQNGEIHRTEKEAAKAAQGPTGGAPGL